MVMNLEEIPGWLMKLERGEVSASKGVVKIRDENVQDSEETLGRL